MSKVVMSLPGGMIKNSLIGAAIALGSYVTLQFLVALLVDNGVVEEGAVYLAACICAGAASFLGCAYSALRVGGGMALSAASVVIIFFMLVLTISMCAGEAGGVEMENAGGIITSMAVGGLSAAVICGVKGKGVSGERGRGKRRKK